MHEDFSAGLKRFIEQHIESVSQLEALLLLRENPQRPWDPAEIAKELYIHSDAASTMLADFARRGFARRASSADAYLFHDSEANPLIDELAAVYRDRRVAVISLIYSKPVNKVQTFADAFRFGKENPP
jgi:hypothetical protein